MLSERYYTGFEYNDIATLSNQQFNTSLIESPALWKKLEFWPDNFKCKESSNAPKLFLICNPTWPGMVEHNLNISNNTHKILLYTDLKLQLRMAYEKKAYWFTEVSRKQFNAPANNKTYLKQIITSGLWYDNHLSDPELLSVVEKFKPEQFINLQEFIKTKTLPGFALPNNKQIQFLDYWVSIQPNKSKFLLEK
jgi:hypothetical protein